MKTGLGEISMSKEKVRTILEFYQEICELIKDHTNQDFGTANVPKLLELIRSSLHIINETNPNEVQSKYTFIIESAVINLDPEEK